MSPVTATWTSIARGSGRGASGSTFRGMKVVDLGNPQLCSCQTARSPRLHAWMPKISSSVPPGTKDQATVWYHVCPPKPGPKKVALTILWIQMLGYS